MDVVAWQSAHGATNIGPPYIIIGSRYVSVTWRMHYRHTVHAFVNCFLLIQRMRRQCVPGHIFYPLGRTQSVRVVNNISSPLPVRSGVPQGSILGPLLFLIYVNDITSLNFVSQHNLFLYADDMLLLHLLNFPADIILILTGTSVIFILGFL